MIRKLIEYQEKIIMDKHIHTPITEEITADLKAGDYVYITGSQRCCTQTYDGSTG